MSDDNDAINEFIDNRYGGDRAKVIVKVLDYAEILTPSDLLRWSINAFEIDGIKENEVDEKKIIDTIYDALAMQCKRNYVITELNKKKLPSDLKEFVYDFCVATSFHFYRDYGKRIDFLEIKRKEKEE